MPSFSLNVIAKTHYCVSSQNFDYLYMQYASQYFQRILLGATGTSYIANIVGVNNIYIKGVHPN